MVICRSFELEEGTGTGTGLTRNCQHPSNALHVDATGGH
jgi:hypothetical protein